MRHHSRIRRAAAGIAIVLRAVSGALLTPRGPAPKHGWPIVSWAHGSSGTVGRAPVTGIGTEAPDPDPASETEVREACFRWRRVSMDGRDAIEGRRA